ncbi:DUF1801 domain-containing protein [Parafilimonas sp.]|uniref:DUF1801 domain-containing protein n=1 Tax=Parafilimonas sp. TaxID=1969739 RepID=UPI0039E6DC6C
MTILKRRPVLNQLRKIVHNAGFDAEETIKRGMPFFNYKGSSLCAMAAFKEHYSFMFWKARLMKDPEGIMQVSERDSMGNFGRITSVKDIPPEKIY